MKDDKNKIVPRRKGWVGRSQSLEKLGYWDITDPTHSANYLIADNFSVKENISRVMLSGFYMDYRKTINKLNEKLLEEEKRQILEPLSIVMNQNESKFYNSFVNLMGSNEDELEKLGSAIQTSLITFNTEETGRLDIEQSFISVCDSVLHFFDRLNVYKLMPSWSFGFRIINKDATQMWYQPPVGYVSKSNWIES